MKKLKLILLLLIMAFSFAACGNNEPELVDIQILATSDLHGKFMPWDYIIDSESYSGSLTQLATAVNEKRNDNTLVLDAGDIVQDNNAEGFLDADVHPMIQAMNYIGYDAWTTGNHEYNYGINELDKIIKTQNAQLLLCNVYDENGDRIGKPYEIFERSGVRIAVVGMVTTKITYWDKTNLETYTVTNPVDECKALLPEIEAKADVIIALAHMCVEDEEGVENSGTRSLAEACPEFDLIISAHDHELIEGEYLGSVLTIENKNQAQTMSEIHISVEKKKDACNVASITSKAIDISQYESEPELEDMLRPYHEQAIQAAYTVIGRLEGGNLIPEDEIAGIPSAQIQDTALMDLIQAAMLHYSGADVSASTITSLSSQLNEGDIRKIDVVNVYKYVNNLCTVKMTGAQLKKYMEWSADYYQQYEEGDLTIAFNPEVRYYDYDMFEGVNYQIDISKHVGERIVNLTWPDGKAVREDESIIVAVTDYRCNSRIMVPGAIFDENDLPEIVEMDIHNSDIGTIRDLIESYIVNVKNSVIKPELNNNWEIIGTDWDEDLHNEAALQINSGILETEFSDDGRTPNVRKITLGDLK